MQSSSSWASVPALPEPKPKPPPEPKFCCPEALRLFAFGQQLYERLIQLPETPTSLQVEKAVSQSNDAILRLTLRWFEIRSTAPQAHKNRLRAADRSPCLLSVYVALLERTLSYQHDIKPPPLAVAPKPPKISARDERRQSWEEELAAKLSS